MKRLAVLLSLMLFSALAATAQHRPTASSLLRGMMIAPRATAQDLRDLAALGVNHVRWQLTWNGFPQSPADTASPEAYRAWLRDNLQYLRILLPLCDSLRLRVLIDLHTLPGGCTYKNGELVQHRIFSSPQMQQEFVRLWEEIAITLRRAPAVWGYDLANEPVEGKLPSNVLNWQSLAQRAAFAIRALDPWHAIVLEGAPSGGVPGFAHLQPLENLSNVTYSFHIYDPIMFTHQGVINQDTLQYPGTISGKYWDANALRKWMQPVRDWQMAYKMPIYVGEFSAIRWAPDSSAYRYLHDCIALFEEWGWSWAYHAWREWDGWSVEHGSDREKHTPEVIPTDRLLLLKTAFQKNNEF